MSADAPGPPQQPLTGSKLHEHRRQDLTSQLLGADYQALTPVQRSVIDLIVAEAPTHVAPILVADERRFWERLADQVAAVGGSWGFIGAFGLFLAVWITLNALARAPGWAFDPYPFIFLNLMLSTLAAIQAPVILMSQNRQAARDRRMAEHDYRINLRAELEIMHLHDKLDALRTQEIAELITRQTEVLTQLQGHTAREPAM